MLYFLASNNYPELNNINVFVNVYGPLPRSNRLPIDGENSANLNSSRSSANLETSQFPGEELLFILSLMGEVEGSESSYGF
jgi:hypothetical protein